MTVTVYSKPGCVQCSATCRELERNGLEFAVFDLSVDKAALAYVISLGYAQAPVVATDDDHWSGFRPDKIQKLARLAFPPARI